MTTKMDYNSIPQFEKDLKRLLKRFGSLFADIEEAKIQVLEPYHIGSIDSRAIFPIPGFCFGDVVICKLKKFACKSLKNRGNRSGIRIIYAFYLAEPKIEFIEIYHKSDQANEDKSRIQEYLKNNSL